ncbi:hypothetical protein SRHO_G00279050 [Serrasalmus rhombeus]
MAIVGWSLGSGPIIHWTGPLTLRVDPHRASSLKGPAMPELTGVRKHYWNLKEFFSKQKAQVLLSHRGFDCTINLLPGITPPHSQLFMLLPPEQTVMED